MDRSRCWIWIIAGAVLAPAIARAQPGDDSDSLRGPHVPPAVSRTLLRHGAMGEFQRIEGRPEAAAVALLPLDEPTRRRVDAIVNERAMAVGLLLVDRIDDVRAITDALAADDRDEARALLEGLWAALEPERPRDPLIAPLADVLAPDQLAEVKRLTDEYWGEWIAWELRSLPPEQDGAARAEAARRTLERLSFVLFQEEARQGYEATLRPYRDALDALYAAVDPTPDQRAAMRTIVIEHIRATRLTPTPEQRRQATLAIYRALDEVRRERLFTYLLRQVVPDQS